MGKGPGRRLTGGKTKSKKKGNATHCNTKIWTNQTLKKQYYPVIKGGPKGFRIRATQV